MWGVVAYTDLRDLAEVDRAQRGDVGDRERIAGERFTVADITALCAIDFGKVSEIRLKAETHPNLVAWHKRVTERPSAKA